MSSSSVSNYSAWASSHTSGSSRDQESGGGESGGRKAAWVDSASSRDRSSREVGVSPGPSLGGGASEEAADKADKDGFLTTLNAAMVFPTDRCCGCFERAQRACLVYFYCLAILLSVRRGAHAVAFACWCPVISQPGTGSLFFIYYYMHYFPSTTATSTWAINHRHCPPPPPRDQAMCVWWIGVLYLAIPGLIFGTCLLACLLWRVSAWRRCCRRSFGEEEGVRRNEIGAFAVGTDNAGEFLRVGGNQSKGHRN